MPTVAQPKALRPAVDAEIIQFARDYARFLRDVQELRDRALRHLATGTLERKLAALADQAEDLDIAWRLL